MLACCVARGREGLAEGPLPPCKLPANERNQPHVGSREDHGCTGVHGGWSSRCVFRRPGADGGGQLPAEEEALDFLDCIDPELELWALLHPGSRGLPGPQLRPPPGTADEATPPNARSDCCSADLVAAATALGANCCGELASELAAAAAVLESTREQWSRRVMDLRKGFDESCAVSELQWADLSQAQRMLRANVGDVQKAVEMFIQALEFRARDRELFESLRCDVRCDMRIIGRDLKEHPVVYMCARSQTEPLRYIRDQFVVTFEAACKLASPEGRVLFVADMHGLRPQLNMDMSAVKDLADTLGTVYAERIFRIVIVDFSRAAQAVWWMVKGMLSPVTREKFAFVGEARALEMCRGDFDGPTFERLQSACRINRDPASSPHDRALHARRTTIHSVPLGPPLHWEATE